MSSSRFDELVAAHDLTVLTPAQVRAVEHAVHAFGCHALRLAFGDQHLLIEGGNFEHFAGLEYDRDHRLELVERAGAPTVYFYDASADPDDSHAAEVRAHCAAAVQDRTASPGTDPGDVVHSLLATKERVLAWLATDPPGALIGAFADDVTPFGVAIFLVPDLVLLISATTKWPTDTARYSHAWDVVRDPRDWGGVMAAPQIRWADVPAGAQETIVAAIAAIFRSRKIRLPHVAADVATSVRQ